MSTRNIRSRPDTGWAGWSSPDWSSPWRFWSRAACVVAAGKNFRLSTSEKGERTVPPRYSPTDEPDKLDSEPVEAAAQAAPAQSTAAVTDTGQEQENASRE